MKTFVSGIVGRATLVLGLGATSVAMSEFWFYEVAEDVDSTLILLAYGVLCYLFSIVVQRFHVHSLAGLTVAAALLGFLIEGVPVPVVYSNPPLSIVWTSLAWHGALTVCVGWFVYRRVLTKGHAGSIVAMNVALGVFLGLWNAFMWNAQEVEDATEFVFIWQPTRMFAAQFLFGYVLFLAGHSLLELAYPRNLTYGRIEHLVLWGLAAALSFTVALGHGLLAQFLLLPGLIIGCLIVLRKEARSAGTGQTTILARLHEKRIPLWRFGWSALIPMSAIPTYAIVVTAELRWEMNVVVILTLGPLSVAALAWGVVAIGRRRARTV